MTGGFTLSSQVGRRRTDARGIAPVRPGTLALHRGKCSLRAHSNFIFQHAVQFSHEAGLLFVRVR
jgi:hypothetical protein